MSASHLPQVSLEGEGTDTVAVGAFNDSVVLQFVKPVSWVALDANTAKQIGEFIARAGYAVESKDDVTGTKPIIIEQIRQRIVVKVEHLLKSEIVNGKLDNAGLTANRCVEIMLKEMT